MEYENLKNFLIQKYPQYDVKDIEEAIEINEELIEDIFTYIEYLIKKR